MPEPPDLPVDARRVLALARKDRRAARRAIDELPLDSQVALVCEAPVAQRAELLELAHAPERLIPALPEAELVFTVKALGLADAGWILAHATDEQVQTCVDLDAWSGELPDRGKLGEWLAALAEGGDETLLRAAHAVDPELLMLWLADIAEVHLKQGDDPGWQAPAGAQTVDGVFFLVGRESDDDLQLALRLLALLFEEDYWFYFRLLQSVPWESSPENEEFAQRWRTGRLQDLGFPPREEALAIYAPPRREELELLADAPPPIGEWHLPVWLPDLPGRAGSPHLLFRAAAELDDDARRPLFFAFVSLANQVAVADGLSLGDAESLPKAIEKAAQIASRGLAWLADRHELAPAEVLRRAPLLQLFRVGFRLDRTESAA
jgi:hypothetical protein